METSIKLTNTPLNINENNNGTYDIVFMDVFSNNKEGVLIFNDIPSFDGAKNLYDRLNNNIIKYLYSLGYSLNLLRLFAIDDDGNKEEITDLYWFEENGVRDFGGEGHNGRKYKIEIEIDGSLVWNNTSGNYVKYGW